MEGDDVPPEHHVALHCQPKAFIDHDENGAPTGVNADAFRCDQDGISAAWIEYDKGTLDTASIVLSQQRTVRKTHRLGVMNVGQIHSVAADLKFSNLTVKHNPLPSFECHALIGGVKPADTTILQALTLKVSLVAFPAICFA